MLTPVSVGNKSLADYTHLAGRPLIEEIRELAKDLEGLRVLHLSATAFGGGVSEILYTLIPLMNDVGIAAEWQVMLGREEFYTRPSACTTRCTGSRATARRSAPSSGPFMNECAPTMPASSRHSSIPATS